MASEHELPNLAEEPRDAREGWGADASMAPDTAVYRLGMRALAVPGLPDEIQVADVTLNFIPGPVRAQVTEMRQRHGLPVHFDKHMSRKQLGDGELICLLRLSAPAPENLDRALTLWRQRALAAAGMVATILDERVVGRELFEDMLLYRGGSFVGAADRRELVRTYLPFEVNTADQAALDKLAGVSLDEASDVARAARLYRKAAGEGPTADAFALLWMAAECFSEHRSPSRKDIEAALEEAGLDPEGLPVPVGNMIGLRADVQHHGLEDHEQLRVAFYEMEAIVRCLIRHAAGIKTGWWFAADNPGAFADPFKPVVAELHGPGETTWHAEMLPVAQAPQAQRIPREVARPIDDPRVDVDPEFGGLADVIASVVVEAIEWLDPDAEVRVISGRPDEAPPDASSGANHERIWIAPEAAAKVDPETGEGLGSFVWELFAAAGYLIAQQAGIADEDDGEALVEAIGAWMQYTRLVAHGDVPAEWLNLPEGTDSISIGKLAGWAAAGHHDSRKSLRDLSGHAGDLATALHAALTENPPCPAVALLDEMPDQRG